MTEGETMSDDDRDLIEEMHEAQREMALAFVKATMDLATRTSNNPLLTAMERAHDVLQHQPPPPGAERREWLDKVLKNITG